MKIRDSIEAPGVIRIVLLLIIIALGYALVLMSTRDESSLTGEFTPKEYRSEKYGFSFSYPREYALEHAQISGEDAHYFITLTHEAYAFLPEGGEGPPQLSVSVYTNQEKKSLAVWTTMYQKMHGGEIKGKIRETVLAGLPALRYDWDGLYQGTTLTLLHEGNVLVFTGTYNDPTDIERGDFLLLLDTIKTVPRIASFDEALEYVKKNIREISPEKEVLGGTFYITEFFFDGYDTARVSYEDGHNAFNARVQFARNPDNSLRVLSFTQQ